MVHARRPVPSLYLLSHLLLFQWELLGSEKKKKEKNEKGKRSIKES
jgi:hypothetical protein